MDLTQFSNIFRPMTCIMSVRKMPDGGYGDIRIVTGNQAYMDSNEEYAKMSAGEMFGFSFKPNEPYTRYLPRDLNFEEFCYQCAILGKTMNTYIKPERLPFWIHLTMVPLNYQGEDPDVVYCTYSQDFSKEADPNLIEVSPDIASAVINTCVKLHSSDDFEETMREVITEIRDICGANHCSVLLTDSNERKCRVLCETSREEGGMTPISAVTDDDFYEIAESWMDTIAGSTCIIAKDSHDFEVLQERNPRWYTSLMEAGIKSIILFPLKNRNEVIGYIWAVNFNVANALKIKETLELTTYFIAAQIANYQMVDRLKTLSTMDLLTGVFNRNAMNNRVEEFLTAEETESQSVGVVFADLNGLKVVNDCDGHYAGDLMLKNAALVLMKCFPDCEIYRAGGDEFAVMAVDMPESELHRRIVQLRETVSVTEGVSFAVGCCTRPAREVRAAMRLADERMYEDKLMFYKVHPDLRRK
jgi:diguanylate cyclase (GGDEF)-like protein